MERKSVRIEFNIGENVGAGLVAKRITGFAGRQFVIVNDRSIKATSRAIHRHILGNGIESSDMMTDKDGFASIVIDDGKSKVSFMKQSNVKWDGIFDADILHFVGGRSCIVGFDRTNFGSRDNDKVLCVYTNMFRIMSANPCCNKDDEVLFNYYPRRKPTAGEHAGSMDICRKCGICRIKDDEEYQCFSEVMLMRSGEVPWLDIACGRMFRDLKGDWSVMVNENCQCFAEHYITGIVGK